MSTTTETSEAPAGEKPKRSYAKPQAAPVDSRYRLLDVSDVLALTKWSLVTLNKRVADGDFPQPIEGTQGMRRKWTLAQYEACMKRKQDRADKVA